MTDQPELPEGFAVRVIERLHPMEIEQIIDKTSSMQKFRKLAHQAGLLFHVQGTRTWVEPTFYLSKAKGQGGHNIGDVKDAGFERRAVSLAMIDMNKMDFGAQATWYERFPVTREGVPKPPLFEFTDARVGGQRTGSRPAKFFTAPTPMTEEINRCLTA